MAAFDSPSPPSQFPETQVLDDDALHAAQGAGLFGRLRQMLRDTLDARQPAGDWLDTMTLRR